jgi:2-polyprenyl-3-methyl-5-hydroxy-6-metoxy-1,4-benzoquinol methylase
MRAGRREGYDRRMSEFDVDALFGPEYLRFYGPMLTDLRSDAETETIRRLAQLEPGARVLDAPCGHGRIANRLALAGARVTGVDITEPFLEIARDQATEWGVDVDYRAGDLRELGFDGEFDVVLNWFTSFGYWDDDVNRRVLEGFAQALVPGGRLVMEMNHRDSLLRRMLDVTVVQSDDDFMIDRHRYEPATSRMITERTMVVGAERRTTTFEVRMFAATEMRDWLTDAGFGNVELFSDDMSELTIESRRMLVRATR